MNIPVFDLHCDTALELLGRGDQPEKNLRSNDCHIDLERAGKLAGYCQCFACFTTPMMEEWMKVTPQVVFENELRILNKALTENSDLIKQAFTAFDVEENQKNEINTSAMESSAQHFYYKNNILIERKKSKFAIKN